MMNDKKILFTKAMLLISGIAFLCLITSARKAALCGCFVAIVFWCAFLWKSSVTFETLKSMCKPIYLILGFLLSCAAGSSFYSTWVVSGKIQRISGIFGVWQEKFGLFCTILGILAAAPVLALCLPFFASMAIADLGGKGQEDSGRENGVKRISIKKAFFLLSAIYTLGISAILRANFNYIDDMGRVFSGYKGWAGFSRFLSDALSPFIHMDHYLTDVSPVPQMIAVVLLSLSGIILLWTLCGRICFSIGELIALIPLGLNPYFLECISYKYDSPYMALSILGAVFPFLYKQKSRRAYIGASMLGTVTVCTSYQAASGIYPMLATVLALKMWNAKAPLKETGNFCLCSMAGYGLGMLFFKTVIMVPVEDYVSNSLFGIKELVPGIVNNLKTYYSLVRSDFKTFWLVFVAVLAVGFFGATVCSSKRKKYQAAVVAVLSVLLMGVLCFGMYPTLTKPLFAPRAMYGFGVFITILGVNIVGQQGKILFQAAAFAVSWTFFVFAFTYGNALYTQKEYTDFRIQAVIDDLNDMDVFLAGQAVSVQISGTIGQSPVIQRMPQNYQILNRLIPITFQGPGWGWGKCGFYNYYGLKNVVEAPLEDVTTNELPVLEDKMYHTIKGKDNYILVELK